MPARDSGPSPSKIVVSPDDKAAKKPSTYRGEKTRSRAGLAACFFPLLGFGFFFLTGGVMAGGVVESRYYLLGTLTLLFILGAGAGMGLGAAFEPRRKKLAPVLAMGLNGAAFFFVLLVSLFPPEEPPAPEFEVIGSVGSAVVPWDPSEV